MNSVTVSVPKSTPRRQIIVTAVARALEDALPTIPPDDVPVRRMVFNFVLEFREGRTVVVDADVTFSKIRAITIAAED